MMKLNFRKIFIKIMTEFSFKKNLHTLHLEMFISITKIEIKGIVFKCGQNKNMKKHESVKKTLLSKTIKISTQSLLMGFPFGI